MSSSRLPAKSLLPIGGYPLAILSAKRAANTGRDVILATSTEASDDALARAAARHEVTCARGSLDNPLERLVWAVEGYADDDLVFRLTADNVFPDGDFLDQMEATFIAEGHQYLGCHGESSGLPYGVSAELTTVGLLREALTGATTDYDREHVTPFIRRQHDAVFSQFKSLNCSHYRATIDTFDDYIDIESLFAAENDPIAVPLSRLIERLTQSPQQPIVKQPCDRLVLGTAQLGMPYGIANQSGQPTASEAERIVRTAITNGVCYLDTARAYGNSESVVGHALRGGWQDRVCLISKLSPLTEIELDEVNTIAFKARVTASVEASVWQSCVHLGRDALECLMLHRAEHLTAWDGAVMEALATLKADGRVNTIGVSVQSPDELAKALGIEEIGVIQMPFNVLDWRFDELIPRLRQARATRGLIVHTRSALLQGALTSEDKSLWSSLGVDEPKLLVNWLQQSTRAYRCDSALQFCLRYCLSQSWIDGVVIGIDTEDQLIENLRLCEGRFQVAELEAISRSRPRLPEQVLNPARWPTP